MRVLVVEDERGIADFVRRGLLEAGYTVDLAASGTAGYELATAKEYDVLILDIMLPQMDGVQVLKELRRRGNCVPTIFLTAKNGVEARVEGLDAGADDYLAKPFSFAELLARVRALLRRPPLTTGSTIRLGGLEMDIPGRMVSLNGIPIELSHKEFQLLEFFLRNPGQVLSRNQIVDHVWGSDLYGDSNVVDVYVGYLRRKIVSSDETSPIETVRGVGYRLRARD